MEKVEKVFNQLIEYKKQNIPDQLKREFASIGRFYIHDCYYLLSPTQRNISYALSFTSNNKNELVIITDTSRFNKKYKNNFDIEYSLIYESRKKQPCVDSIVKEIKDHCIVIENSKKFKEYLEVVKTFYKLEGKRYVPPKRIETMNKEFRLFNLEKVLKYCLKNNKDVTSCLGVGNFQVSLTLSKYGIKMKIIYYSTSSLSLNSFHDIIEEVDNQKESLQVILDKDIGYDNIEYLIINTRKSNQKKIYPYSKTFDKYKAIVNYYIPQPKKQSFEIHYQLDFDLSESIALFDKIIKNTSKL